MPLESASLQTPVTDFSVAGILDGRVTGMDVLDPTENNEKTSLLEVDDEFDVSPSSTPSTSPRPSRRKACTS